MTGILIFGGILKSQTDAAAIQRPAWEWIAFLLIFSGTIALMLWGASYVPTQKSVSIRSKGVATDKGFSAWELVDAYSWREDESSVALQLALKNGAVREFGASEADRIPIEKTLAELNIRNQPAQPLPARTGATGKVMLRFAMWHTIFWALQFSWILALILAITAVTEVSTRESESPHKMANALSEELKVHGISADERKAVAKKAFRATTMKPWSGFGNAPGFLVLGMILIPLLVHFLAARPSALALADIIENHFMMALLIITVSTIAVIVGNEVSWERNENRARRDATAYVEKTLAKIPMDPISRISILKPLKTPVDSMLPTYARYAVVVSSVLILLTWYLTCRLWATRTLATSNHITIPPSTVKTCPVTYRAPAPAK